MAATAPPRATLGIPWRAVPPLAAAIALGFGLLASVRYLARPLAILILAITIGEALEPMVTRLEKRMRRSFAIAVVYLVLLGLIALGGWLLVPELIRQAREIGDQLPALIDRGQAFIARWDQAAGGGLARTASERLGQLGGSLVSVPIKAFAVAVEIVLIIFLSAYWLLGSPALLRFVLSLLPPDARTRTAAILEEMGDAMGGYVRGAAISAAIMGALAWLGLLAIGVEYALALGALTTLGEPIPYVGPILVGGVVTLVALAQSPTKALLAIGLYTLLQQIESNFIAPNVLSRETRTSQALVIFALVAGAAVGGLLGALVAIPLASALQVFVVRVLAPAIRRRTGA
ncbi:MAG TPA: AI-2E family transporter [Gemmatimonadales bacterium]|nr:AI-2E family transporter [Gemmatimonadales bacterium]